MSQGVFSFSKLGNYGRLGNQLFQIAATIGLAEKHGCKTAFPRWQYAEFFERMLPAFDSIEFDYKVSEPHFHFSDLTLDRSKRVDLEGYFQSEKYFIESKTEISKLFSFEINFLNTVQEKFNSLVPSFINGGYTGDVNDVINKVSVHVRRGDYVQLQDSHPPLPVSYYQNAVDHISTRGFDPVFYIFSDDIQWCKDNLRIPGACVYVEGNSDIEDLCMMSMCDHYIIANSSFSWWGAWLGEIESSIVIAPDQWFGPTLKRTHDERDLIPERWIRIPVIFSAPADVKKHDLKDVTFTIPVKYDHPDRRENLELCIAYLKHHFDTNIMVYEMDEAPKLADMERHCTYKFIEGKDFHRTRLLNMMGKDAQTPIIVNYDCDVFFSPAQIVEAVQKIRNNQADGVFPYDGRFYRIGRNFYPDIARTLSLVPVQGMKFPEEIDKTVSYGGCIIWNKFTFFEGGGENENMISWGPEDYERVERFRKLGFSIDRITGPLWHLNHFVGKDSNHTNCFFDANRQEFEKIRALSKDDLSEYVKSWKWKDLYDEAFYKDIKLGAAYTSGVVLTYCLHYFKTRQLLDVGCGCGAWGRNWDFYTGVDGEYVKPENLLIPAEKFIAKDVSKPFDLGKKYDMVISLEVGEHLYERCAEDYIDNLCRHTDNHILFSAAIPGQGGNCHINEQWQSWWAEKFIKRGFVPSLVLRDLLWNNPEVPYWYKQNLVLYVHEDLARVKAATFNLNDVCLNIIHPDKWKAHLSN